MTRKPADFERVGDLLKGICGPPVADIGTGAPEGKEGGGDASQTTARLLALVWPEIVGEEVAANARPVQLRQGRLVVSASSSAWAQTLQLMGDTVVGRVNDRLGAGTVDTVFFRHAGWERSGGRTATSAAEGGLRTEAPDPAAGPMPGPTPEEEEAIARVRKLGLQPGLEESIVRAVRASFRRA